MVASDGRRRRFLWTLELQQRPPDSGKWLIYGVLSSDVDGMLTMEGKFYCLVVASLLPYGTPAVFFN